MQVLHLPLKPIYADVYFYRKIVLVPIILGIVLNYFIGSKIEPVKSVCPTIAAIAVLLILAAVTAVNQKQIAETGFIIFVAC